MEYNILLMIVKLLLAALLGGVVGFEREVHERPAGLRTHILVCLGAALFTIVSASFSPASDPARIAAQVVSGIGFLGGGTILRQGNIVRGLTTAASLWAVAGIGMAVAAGGYLMLVAVTGTAIVVLTLWVVRYLETGLSKRFVRNLTLEVSPEESFVADKVMQEYAQMGISVQKVRSYRTSDGDKRVYRFRIVVPAGITQDTLLRVLSAQSAIDRFECE
jgi:putative Mg2+ transporter-C (MgtC) family protein